MKLTDFKVDETITFDFVGTIKTGKIISINTKDNTLEVKTANNMFYKVYLTEKESKFCFLIKN